jgi:serine/threonine protein kinase
MATGIFSLHRVAGKYATQRYWSYGIFACLSVILSICAGICHRDVSLENYLVDGIPGQPLAATDTVSIMDFGKILVMSYVYTKMSHTRLLHESL